MVTARCRAGPLIRSHGGGGWNRCLRTGLGGSSAFSMATRRCLSCSVRMSMIMTVAMIMRRIADTSE